MLETFIPYVIGLIALIILVGRLKGSSRMIRLSAEAARAAKAAGMDVNEAVRKAQLEEIQKMKSGQSRTNPIFQLLASLFVTLILSYIAWSWMTEIPAPISISSAAASYWRYLTVMLPPVMVFIVRLRRFGMIQTASSGGLKTQQPSHGLETLERLILPFVLGATVLSVGAWVALAYIGY